MSFRNDFRIILLEERIGFKMDYLKRQGASKSCDWAGALGKMGHDAGSVRKERRDEK
jgi:hypothetical protein